MDAFLQMRLHENDLTPAEKRVRDAVLANPEAVLQCTTTMVAKRFEVSQSAISRFCQKIGFESFTDFRMGLMLSLSSHTPSEGDESTRRPVDYLCDMVEATDSCISPGTLDSLVDSVLGARQVYVTGGGMSCPPALMLNMELLKYNIPSIFVDSGQEMIHMHVACARDLVIIFSSKNDTQRMLLNGIREMPKERRPRTILVTHASDHPLRRLVDQVICLPTWQSERYPVYIEPMTSMLAFCSILMLSISQRQGEDPTALPPFVNGEPLAKGIAAS